MNERPKVGIIGGGIAGLSAAHVLINQGFDVTVIEAQSTIGGQAKSGYTSDHKPTEHSLRIIHNCYKNFYKILADLQQEDFLDIDYNLSDVDLCARYQDQKLDFKTTIKRKNFFHKFFNMLKALSIIFKNGLKINEFFKLLHISALHMACEARLLDKYDKKSTADFLQLYQCSKIWFHTLYKIPEIMGGAKPHSSALLSLSLLNIGFDFISDVNSIKMFNGPSSESLFKSWQKYLVKKGCKFILREKVYCLNTKDNIIKDCVFESFSLKFDYYVMAVDYTQLKCLLTNSKIIHLFNLKMAILDECFEWSNGSQFYLNHNFKNQEFAPGLINVYLDSPWSIVSINQGKGFWGNFGETDPNLQLVSATYTNSYRPGIIYKKPLTACNPEEIKEEILAQTQMKDKIQLTNWHLDDALQYVDTKQFESLKPQLIKNGFFQKNENQWLLNLNPLFVPRPGYYNSAPCAATPFNNLYMAGEFCSTSYKAPTMEKAAESGFRAACALLKYARPKLKLKILTNYENNQYFILRKLDKWLYKIFHKK